MLYKRPFRKGKEVVTFLIKARNLNLAIALEALSQMRRLNGQYSLRQQAGRLSHLAPKVQELPIPTLRKEIGGGRKRGAGNVASRHLSARILTTDRLLLETEDPAKRASSEAPFPIANHTQ